jgi:uncharacterized repeat protein (TIGR01451 family)
MSLRLGAATAATLPLLVLLTAAPALAVGNVRDAEPGLSDQDTRGGKLDPTAAQRQAVSNLGASARWNRFGTPQSLSKNGGYLATGVSGDNAVTAARSWLEANKAAFGLASTESLVLYADSTLARSDGHAVNFRQEVGGLSAGHDGLVTVGITGTAASGWKVAYASSSLTRDAALSGTTTLSAVEAWLSAASNVGRTTTVLNVGNVKTDGDWKVFAVNGFADMQRVRLVAVPTFTNGVRPAYEALVLDHRDGGLTGYRSFVDAATGAVLIRQNVVFSSHPAAASFTGAVPQTDGACDVEKGPWVVDPNESVSSIDVAVEAALTTNDSVIHLKRDGVIVASQDTAASPEALHYAPGGGVPSGSYTVQVCDFVDAAPWDTPNTYAGTIAFNSVAPSGVPYPPKWRVFPAYPEPPTLAGYPWNIPGNDIRKLWCWDSVVGGNPVSGCEDEVQNLAARVPWDVDVNTGAPHFTTRGNAAISTESWTDPVAPGATGFAPSDQNRNYSFPFTNQWYTSRCAPAFVPGQSQDISAAVTNLFAMHNRMHDWSYLLGFTEENWNAQQDNFGGGGAENDPVLGDAQAGAATGGYPDYLGRDNANMRPLPDGVPAITNMYLWQPLRAAFYAPCVDGDYDMSVIGHEYTHLIENRMIGKGGTRSGHHAGAMGESYSDLNAMEILNEYGFVPVSGEDPYAVGAFATGNKQRGIRNYGMDKSPLNFSDMGYDAFSASPVHADGEIWSATNFELRQALNAKYDGSYPSSDKALQRACAEAKKAPEDCPGNRRWIQIMYDAFLLMPTGPSMLDSRDAYLAADMMRFGGANQAQLWGAFAHRGMGAGATSTNAFTSSDTDPTPDFASGAVGASNATVTFSASASDEANAAITKARVFVGAYEARTSPIADTDPTTSGQNLDGTASFMPGTYDFLVQAPGYGAVRFTRTFTAGQNVTLNIAMPTNWASSAKGATTSGDGAATEQANLIDDTENTNWTFTGPAGTTVAGKQVTVALGGGSRTIDRVQVSASLNAQNRFTALRQFAIEVSTDGTSFTRVFTSAPDAFPGASPRPTLPDLILRSFTFAPVPATHVRLVVLTNQCTGQTDFHGVQDNDLLNPTDCRGTGEPAGTDPAGQAPAAQPNIVRAAELQVFAARPATADLSIVKTGPATGHVGQQMTYTIKVTNNGPSSANGVLVVDTLPKNTGFGSATSTQGSCGPRPKSQAVDCNVGTMASGAVVTITLLVKPTQKGTYVNTATVSATSPADPNTSNNTSQATTTVTP